MPNLKTGGIMTIEGLDTSKPAEYISEKNTPDCQNMSVDRGVLRKRIGTSSMGATMSEEIMTGQEFEREGVYYNVRVGLTKIHKWNSGTSAWDNITGADLTGTVDDPIDIATPLLSGLRIFCFTNNVDAIRKYNGTGNTADLGGSPPVCKFMVAYESYLVLAYITSGGNTYSARVQWPDTGDPETWSGGNSGSKDLVEDGEDITGIALFSNYVSVHKNSSIYLGYLVSTSSIFRFERRNTGVGTICNATIQNLPTGEQGFLAYDGIHLFNGTSAPLIESKVTDDLREQINPEYVHKSWSIVVPELDEYWVAVPLGASTEPDDVFKYNYYKGTCHRDVRSDITAAWKYHQTSGLTWDQMTGTWDDQTARWNDSVFSKLFQIVSFGGNTGISTERSAVVNNDNGTAIDGYWDTKDFTSRDFNEGKGVPGMLVRWEGMEIWAKGSTVTISYSTDSGETWQGETTITLSDEYPADDSPIMYYFDMVSTKVRFRSRNNVSAETFCLKQFVIDGVPREMRNR